jgi:hypothetical protein
MTYLRFHGDVNTDGDNLGCCVMQYFMFWANVWTNILPSSSGPKCGTCSSETLTHNQSIT